jgi:uncharacterized delta-60 repeat protein
MKTTRLITFGALSLILAINSANAQQLILDNSFSDDGIQTSSLAPLDCYVESIAIQTDGKPIIAGWTYDPTNTDFVVARYNIDGTPDITWGGDGIVTTDFNSSFDQAQAVKIQDDGKVVLVGFSDSSFAIARYNVDGSLDNSFNLTGKKVSNLGVSAAFAYSAAIQPDGKIIAVGFAIYGNVNMAIARFTTSGELDASFSGDGVQLTDYTIGEDKFWDVVVQPDNKILAVGHTADLADINFAAVRYNPDGSLDNTFGSDGRMSDYFLEGDAKCYSVALDADNNIYLGGSVDGKFALERLTPNGEPDYTFGTWAQVVTSIGYSIKSILVRDDKIYVAGSKSSKNCIARFNNTGETDLTFDDDGYELSDLSAGSGIVDMKFNVDGDIITASASSIDLLGVLNYYKIHLRC